MSVLYWDFDGTLVKSNPLWTGSVFKAINDTAEYNIEFQDIRKYMAYGFTWHTPNNDYSTVIGDKWWDFMNCHFYNCYISLGVNKSDAQTAVLKIRDIIKDAENYELYSDTISTLKILKEKGHINIILSNNYPDLPEVLKKLGIYNLFDGFIISAIEGYDKPRKEIFDKAKSLNTNNEKIYMIGDSVNADIIGGNTAEMTTIYVHNGYCEFADYCVDNLSDIIEIID